MDALKKSKLITGLCGIGTAGALTALVCSLMFAPGAQAQEDTVKATVSDSTGSKIEVEVDPEVYNAFLSMIEHYNNLEADGNDTASAEVAKNGDTYCIVVDGKQHALDGENVEIVETADGRYAIIDGKLYKLIISDADKDAIDAILRPGKPGTSGDDPNAPLGTDADGNAILDWTVDGRPIIGYDDNGEPIYGRLDEDVNPANGDYYHIVWGDTLCKISSELHISVDELAEYNHIRDVNKIYAESDLRIPASPDWTEPAPED